MILGIAQGADPGKPAPSIVGLVRFIFAYDVFT